MSIMTSFLNTESMAWHLNRPKRISVIDVCVQTILRIYNLSVVCKLTKISSNAKNHFVIMISIDVFGIIKMNTEGSYLCNRTI